VLAGVSFAGYVAVKYLGTTHGTLLAGAARGLVSSTAVTITNARRAAVNVESSRVMAAGVALASGVMFLRVLVIAAVVNASLIALLAPALLTAAFAATAFALITGYWRGRDEPEAQEIAFRNPFGFWSVWGFALLLAVVLVRAARSARCSSPRARSPVPPSRTVRRRRDHGLDGALSPRSRSARRARRWRSSWRRRPIRSARSRSGIAGRTRFALELAAMALACLLAGGIALWLTLGLLAR
jgi:uncharacterized membrane protein (DUF4010 family)